MSIILNKDIYDNSQGNPLQPVIDALDMLDKRIEKTSKSMLELETSIKKVNQTGSGSEAKVLLDTTEKLTKETERLTALKKAEESINKQLIAAEAKLVASYSAEAEQLNHVKVESQVLNKQKMDTAKLNSQLIGSYQKLSIELNQIRGRYKDLAAENKHNTAEGRALLKQVADLDNRLKEIDSSVGQYQRNVGNYGSALGRLGGTIKDFFFAGGIVAAIGTAINGLKNFFKSSVTEAQDAAKSWAKVDQAILTTGAAAGFTTEKLKSIADELEAVTNVDADQIMNDVTAQLLTFTKVQGEEFERAQKAALDLSTVLGTDLKGTTIQLGKALQDPIKGLTALRRSGVSFTESQQDVIKSLVKTGQVAEAQRLILSELEKQYGGQAERAAQSGLGQLEKLQIQWNNFKETIGNAIIPIINEFARIAGNALEKFIGFVKESVIWLVDFANGWIQLYNESIVFRYVVESIQFAFTSMWETVKLIFNLMVDNIKGIGEQLSYTFNPKNWGAGFSDGLQALLNKNKQRNIDNVKQYGKNVATAFTDGFADIVKGKKELITFDKKTNEQVKQVVDTETNDISQSSVENKKKQESEYTEWLKKEERDRAAFLKQQEEAALAENEKADQEEIQRAIDNETAMWQAKIELAEENQARLQEMHEKRKAMIEELSAMAVEQLGYLVASGELSMKEFSKFVIMTGLNTLEAMLNYAIAEIWFKQISNKGIAGIPVATILTALVKGVFAGVKSKVQSFATGTDQVTGEGTETSDSIPARLSKNEGVIPAKINKQLLSLGIGATNPRLPQIVAAGLNSQRMEQILDEVKYYSSISAFYLSNGKNVWIEKGKLNITDWKTGITRVRIND
jgi:hypothetical protein